MCGIAGAAGPGVGNRDLLDRMLASMVHRGPDGLGTLVTPGAMLGCARLAIIDVEGGGQPIHGDTEDVAVVGNGEIYNHRELRRRLEARGHRFRTHSDIECVVHLYEDHGADLARHLRGMFAFAVWDGLRNRLLLGRDRVGKKPLYYRRDGERIWFASELKALLQDPTFERRLDPISLDHYLTLLSVPGPRSILRDVGRVPAGHTLSFEGGAVDVQRYWHLDYEPKHEMSDGDAADGLVERLREATRLRMVSERPLGAFLSGGVDSSLVVATMAGLSTGPVKTFSVGFEEADYDERQFARMVAERYATDHHEVVVRPDPQVVLEAPDAYDEPFADSSAVATLEVARLASEHVTVVLNGDGGDESFAGYSRYGAAQLATRIPLPAPAAAAGLRALDPVLAPGPPGSTRSRLRAGLQYVAARDGRRYLPASRGFDHRQRRALYTADLRATTDGSDVLELIKPRMHTPRVSNDVERLLLADIETYLADDLLVKMDLATMAHSVEARSPFLDHQLMEFAARLPERMKIRRVGRLRLRKFLLKRVAADVLPPEVVQRRKAGFAVPIGSWLRDELREPARDLLTDRTARDRGLFDPEAVVSLLDEHDAGVEHAERLWGLLRFEMWCRRHLDRRVPA